MSIICAMRTFRSLWLLPLVITLPGALFAAGESGNPLTANMVAAPSSGLIAPSGASTTLAPGLSAQLPIADAIVVRKAERKLYLLRHGEVIRSYRVALGLQPQGP